MHMQALSIRIPDDDHPPDDVYDQLCQAAREQDTSLNAVVVAALRAYLEQRDLLLVDTSLLRD